MMHDSASRMETSMCDFFLIEKSGRIVLILVDGINKWTSSCKAGGRTTAREQALYSVILEVQPINRCRV